MIGSAALFLLRRRVNLLSLGEDEARALGVETRRLRPILVVAATLMISAVVSITGWIGLVVPHVVRMLVGPDFRLFLPVSMVFGAIFLLIIDLLARSVALTEIPLGIPTAVVGAPFFLGEVWGSSPPINIWTVCLPRGLGLVCSVAGAPARLLHMLGSGHVVHSNGTNPARDCMAPAAS